MVKQTALRICHKQPPHFFLISQTATLAWTPAPALFKTISLRYSCTATNCLGFYTLQLLEHEPSTIWQSIKAWNNKDCCKTWINTPHWRPQKSLHFLVDQAALNLHGWWRSESLNRLEQFRPTCLNELADLIALYRPRPLEAGLAQLYLERNREKSRCQTG